MDFVVVAKKGVATSITVLSRKRWKNYGAATVPGSRVLIALIRVYQRLISPLSGRIVVSLQPVQATELRHCEVWSDKRQLVDGETRIKMPPLHPGGDDPVPPGPFDTREHYDGFATQSFSHRFAVRVFHDRQAWEQDKNPQPQAQQTTQTRPPQRVAPPTRAYRPVARGNDLG